MTPQLAKRKEMREAAQKELEKAEEAGELKWKKP